VSFVRDDLSFKLEFSNPVLPPFFIYLFIISLVYSLSSRIKTKSHEFFNNI